MNANQLQEERPALRLARYLKEFVGLRSTTVRDVTKYESVLWFGDMPQEKDCISGAWLDGYETGDPWLEVRKQQFLKPPPLPEAIQLWVDEKALRRATPEIPPLLSTILLPASGAFGDGESPPLASHQLDDHPEVRATYERFRPSWEAWSTEHRRREAIQKVYAELFRLHTQVLKQGEIVELILGVGLVDWRTPINGKTIPIRRHAFVAQVDLQFEPAHGTIRVVPADDRGQLRIEDDMLEAEVRPDPRHYETVAAQLDELDEDIWDRPSLFDALKTWAGSLSAGMQWSSGLGAQKQSEQGPVMSFAPALILRTRTQIGMVRIYDALIRQLAIDSNESPSGWNRLLEDVDDSESAVGTSNGGARAVEFRATRRRFISLCQLIGNNCRS